MATSVAENIACEKQEDIDEPEAAATAMRLADIEEKICIFAKERKDSLLPTFWTKMVCRFQEENCSVSYWQEPYIRTHRFCCSMSRPVRWIRLAETAVYEQYHRLSAGKNDDFYFPSPGEYQILRPHHLLRKRSGERGRHAR